MKMMKTASKVLIEGLHRSKLERIIDGEEYLTAEHSLSPITLPLDEGSSNNSQTNPIRSIC